MLDKEICLEDQFPLIDTAPERRAEWADYFSCINNYNDKHPEHAVVPPTPTVASRAPGSQLAFGPARRVSNPKLGPNTMTMLHSFKTAVDNLKILDGRGKAVDLYINLQGYIEELERLLGDARMLGYKKQALTLARKLDAADRFMVHCFDQNVKGMARLKTAGSATLNNAEDL